MIHRRIPLVSCVTVTRDRAQLLQRAIACYCRQTYPKKELIVLSQGTPESNQEIRQLLAGSGRSDIRFYTANPDLSLGAMRNTVVDLSQGDVVCQWDDDDLFHPERIRTQVRMLRADSNRVASAYSQFLKYFSARREMYWCDWTQEHEISHRYLSGSVLFYKELFDRFRYFYPQQGYQSDVEEDLNALEKLISLGDVASLTTGNEYIYEYHGNNTYGVEHHQLSISSGHKRLLGIDELNARRDFLEETFRCVGLTGNISMMANGQTAFLFNGVPF